MKTLNFSSPGFLTSAASFFRLSASESGPSFVFWDSSANDATPISSYTFDEGDGAQTFYLTLSEEPDSNVTVTLTNTDTGSATLANIGGAGGTALNAYTSGNWSNRGGGHAFTITPVNESNDDSEEFSITTSASGGQYGEVTTPLVIRIEDDDGTLVFDATPDTLSEGGTMSYNVRLSAAPLGDVLVSTSSGDTGAITVTDGSSLTFGPSNWSTNQNITLTAIQDDDATDESVTITYTVAGSGFSGASTTHTVAVTDDDTQGIFFTSHPMALNEGSTATYTARLTTQPTGSVTVSAVSGDTSALTISPASLTFTASTWNTDQSFTITGVEDSDEVDESVTITYTASGADYGSVSTTRSVSTMDNDMSGGQPINNLSFVFADTFSTLNEGDTGTYTVRLSGQPDNNTTITTISSDTGAISVSSGASLMFTTENWATAQSVVLSAQQDSDFDDETVVITTSNTFVGSDSTRTITVVDDEDPSFVFVFHPTTVFEGVTSNWNMRLSALPTGTVTVGIATSDIGALDILPKSYTFTTANWDTPQNVFYQATADDDTDDESVDLTYTASGGGYDSVSEVRTVEVIDFNAASAAFSFGTRVTSLTEGGSAGTESVSLSQAPRGDVTVSVSSDDTDALTVSPATLTFTRDNWSTSQDVTLTPVDDTDTVNESVSVSWTAAGGGFNSVTDTQTVSITDDDSGSATAELTFTGYPANLDERSAGFYRIKLNEAPTGDVTVAITKSSVAVTLTTTSLTFTTSNWSTDQEVQFATGGVLADTSNTFTYTVTGGGFSAASTTKSLSVLDTGLVMWGVDRNTDALYTINTSTQIATRVGTSTQFGIPEGNPNGLVRMNGKLYMLGNSNDSLIEVNDTTGVGTEVDSTLTTFGVSGLSAPVGLTNHRGRMLLMDNNTDSLYELDPDAGTASLIGSVDDDGEDNPRCVASNHTNVYTIGTDVDALYRVNPDTGALTIIVTDPQQDPRKSAMNGLTFHNGALWGVKTNGQPTERLQQVNPVTGAVGQVTYETDASNFGVNARLMTGLASSQIATAGASGSNTMGFVLSDVPGTVAEDGTATFKVKLNAPPSGGDTTVDIISSNTGAATISTGSTLTFSSSNYNTTQDVTISGAEGGGGLAPQIRLSATGGGFDNNYADFFPVVTQVDDSLLIKGVRQAIGDSGFYTFKMKLTSQPSDTVTVTTTSDNTSLYIVTGSSRTFTTSNWDTYQDVTYHATNASSANDITTITLTASGGGNTTVATRKLIL